ncbi:PAS domain-containing protein [Sphingosinicella sp. BN140058]|uniref:PAS domain-containing sensor histidine kinase n=1 Tax=Sphingosinicella sp. BN140058 TaxID=1892855 RepID=UPI0013EDAB5C|nr:PAS domain-containing protein [Sphingosinicella sp. BN140058]
MSAEAVQAQISTAIDALSALEHSAEQRDDHLAFLWEHSPQICWIADHEERVIGISKSWHELTGRPDEEVLGTGWRNFIHSDDSDRYLDALAEARRSGGSYDVRFRGLRQNGEWRWLRTRGYTRVNEEGRTAFIYGFTEDVHEQIKAETKLRSAIERSRLAGLATNDLIYDLDIPTGKISWNASIRDYCSDPAQASLDWWEETIHPADRAQTIASLDAFLHSAEGERWQAEYRMRRLDGAYSHVYERGYVVRGADGCATRMIGAITDLTPRIEAEARVKQLQSELIHVSRLSAMGAMAATLAHELNQPLAAANNWIGVARVLVQRAPEISGQAGDALEEARASIQRAGEIIRRIRAMLSRGGEKREIHDLRDIVDESLRLALLGSGVSGIACHRRLESARVRVDRVQIEQVVLNLVRNGIEAMIDRPRRELVVAVAPRETHAEVRISDSGKGIDPAFENTLFTPFMTSKEEGLGVGLSISRTIVEAHGGKIRAFANPEAGTTFAFTLPLVR